jgi:polysaccharide deacetylase family protein (PEP-CTERM system associated)
MHMIRMLSIDVEDYQQIVYRDQLGVLVPPSNQVLESTLQILQVLREYNTRATFFILGSVAERFPHLVRRIAHADHEIATHGYSHLPISAMSPQEFSNELSLSLSLLRELTDQRVVGHRAPAFSLDINCSWAFDLMVEHGIAYDSSAFATRKRHNGTSLSTRAPHEIRPQLFEVPVSALGVGGVRFLLGGSYFRLCPYRICRWAIKHLEREGLPAVAYLHPYEFYNASTPFEMRGVSIRKRLDVCLLNLKYRINRSRSGEKLRALLDEFRFTSILEGLAGLGVRL